MIRPVSVDVVLMPTSRRTPQTTRVLIVEDNDAMRRLLTFVCERQGFVTEAVNSVAGGLAKLSPPPDLLILDLDLPDGSGVRILRRVRAQLLQTRVAVITALSNPDLTYTVTGLRPDRFLSKPFEVAEIIAWLRAELARDPAGEPVG